MLIDYFNTAEWSHEQWLAATILAFIAVTSIVVLYRLVGLYKGARSARYQPNLRPLRRRSSKVSAPQESTE